VSALELGESEQSVYVGLGSGPWCSGQLNAYNQSLLTFLLNSQTTHILQKCTTVSQSDYTFPVTTVMPASVVRGCSCCLSCLGCDRSNEVALRVMRCLSKLVACVTVCVYIHKNLRLNWWLGKVFGDWPVQNWFWINPFATGHCAAP